MFPPSTTAVSFAPSSEDAIPYHSLNPAASRLTQSAP